MRPIEPNQRRARTAAGLAVATMVGLSMTATAADAAALANYPPATNVVTGKDALTAVAGWHTAGLRVGRLAGPLRGATLGRAGDGDPDPHLFGVDGKVGVHGSSTSDDMLSGISLYPDGRIVAAGFKVEGAQEAAIVTRRDPDGSPDRTFGGGTGIVAVPGMSGAAQKVVPTGDGGLVGTGYTVVDGQEDLAVFRLDASGLPVPDFGQNGLVRIPTRGPDWGLDLVTQPDGRIVAVGSVAANADASAVSVRRFLPSGLPDHSFGTGGEVIIRLSTSGEANGVTVQRDGKIVVVAHSLRTRAGAVIRLNLNGSFDQTFGVNGIQELRVRDLTLLHGVVVQPDNRIAIVGFTRTVSSPSIPGDAVVFRLRTDGRPDTSFNGNGQVVLSNDGNDLGFGIGLGPDNKIIISSFQAQREGVATHSFLHTITSTGELDPTFGVGGTVRVTNPEATFELGLTTQPDGKIVVAGRRGGADLVDSIGTIDRFNPDGSFDKTS